MSFAPVALFAYNRRNLLEATVNSLAANNEAKGTDLFIYSDGWKSDKDKPTVLEVREYLKSIQGFKSVTIFEAEENRGLGKSIISGVSEMIEKFGEVIVLEDDLQLSPWFLKFMNDGLNTYRNSGKVASIHGYLYPVKTTLPETFFLRGADCLGWATWKRAWRLLNTDANFLYNEILSRKEMDIFNFNDAAFKERILQRVIAGENDSWAVRWDASIFLNGMLTLYPGKSLVHHLGADGAGTNTKKTRKLDVVISNEPVNMIKIPETPSQEAWLAIGKFYLSFKAYNPFKRIKFYLKSKNLVPHR